MAALEFVNSRLVNIEADNRAFFPEFACPLSITANDRALKVPAICKLLNRIPGKSSSPGSRQGAATVKVLAKHATAPPTGAQRFKVIEISRQQ